MTTQTIRKTDHLPVVALVGRVNVGKSTVFNCLIEEHKAIVSREPGTTRTKNIGLVRWRGLLFRLIDTGGIATDPTMLLAPDIQKQTEQAIERAHLVVFVTDARAGILPEDRHIATWLKKKKKTNVRLIANKADTNRIEQEMDIREWSRLGFGMPFLISATNGRRTGDFLDYIFEELKKRHKNPGELEEEERPIRVNLLGKPNVGKSSLFNALIGREEVIVSPTPHTTREPHDTLMEYAEHPILFVDTAGIRRKANVAGQIEGQGIQKSIRSVEESDIVLLVLDASEDISHQDKQLAGLLERRGKSVIIILNKWDRAEDKSELYQKKVKAMIISLFPHIDFAPILFVSAKTGAHVRDIFPLVVRIALARKLTIPAPALASFSRGAVKRHKPSRGKGTRYPEILGMRQIGASPPVIDILIKEKTSVHPSYLRYLEHRLREQFDIIGTPVIIHVRKRKK